MTFDIFLSAVMASIFSSGLAVFVLKKLVEHSFNVRVAKLEAQAKIQALEHQVRFTRFDNQVALAIEGAYGLICSYSEAVSDAVNHLGVADEQADQALLDKPEQVANEFFDFMRRNAIYLPPDIYKKMQEVRLGMRDAYSAELKIHRSRAAKDKGARSVFLSSLYSSETLRATCDALMTDLQSMLQKHLSRFIHLT